MKPTDEQVKAGQVVYTKGTLSAYDTFVLGISNRYIWKCPSEHIETHYNKNISANHLDIGVGTGYFLDRCNFHTNSPRIALIDLNPNSLEFASNRISRYSPESYLQNILEPITINIPKFDSVSINYLFHCMPGDITYKTVAFDHIKPLLNSGAKIFGSTILQGGVSKSWVANQLMKFYNKKGIFSNTEDDIEGLEYALKQRFENVFIEIIGCVALFSGTFVSAHEI